MLHAVERVLTAIRVLVDIWPFKRLEAHCESPWSEPSDIQRRIGECPEDQLTRRVEFARDDEPLSARCACDPGLVHGWRTWTNDRQGEGASAQPQPRVQL